MTEESKFWLVWNETTGYTRYRHASRQAAKGEAMRLATQNKGQRFFVLEPAGAAVVRDPCEWVDIEDGIPF